MKKLFVIMAIVLMTTMVNAGPFLVVDDDPNATSYLIKFSNSAEIEVSAPLHHDLGAMGDGLHVVEIKAKNIWGVSSVLPFEFLKELPRKPSNIGLSEE